MDWFSFLARVVGSSQFTSTNCVFSIRIFITVMCVWTCECFSSRSGVSLIPTIAPFLLVSMYDLGSLTLCFTTAGSHLFVT